jgi:signal transduction histidine kinase
VYRLVQEAITNIIKHAKATQVWIGLRPFNEAGADAHDTQVEVSVKDDGVGFDSGAQPGSSYGLLGMRFRVEAEGGSLTVTSAPGQGTEIRMLMRQSTPHHAAS